MYTLLPEQFKKRVLAVYHIRLASAWCAFGIVTVVIGIVALMPAFITAQLRITDVSASSQDKVTDIPGQLQNVERKVSNASKLITTLEAEMPVYIPSEVIHKVIVGKGEGVAFTNFEIIKSADKTISISMQGKVATREILVGLKKKMSAIEGVTKVELPISDLTKSRDIGFTVKLTMAPGNPIGTQ